MESAPNLETLVAGMSGEINFVVGDASATNVLIEKPVHGVTALESHFGGHDGFDFALKLDGGERGLRVFGDEGAHESNEARVGIAGVWLTQHFAEHVKNPRAFGIDDSVVGLGRFGRGKPNAHGERADIGGGDIFGWKLSDEAFAIAIEPAMQVGIGIFLGIGE